ncbi:Outer membrane protein [Roseibacterium elongatum DSM 19469]|uniref:Outer membrane protein n=1 Tax=Roseicyclus elongatus DSM 19469 TaxID=1294273 RepID=W8RQL4_9RHOB|nr:BamA/TamA family outer membrane protein [Roseibacterium elongatum]AHM03424.1 Outer membrane protein [Roseibacterium elongatum DSM 19469]
MGVTLPVSAQQVELRAPETSEELQETLRAASLLFRPASEEPRSAQDILAAARADYARLTAALYDAGHFSPVVRIQLDGREAATISPFAVPAAIARVEIRVDPGPDYRFGEVEIGPLAGRSDAIPEFARGEPASTSVLRDAAAAAIDGWRDRGHALADVAGQQITARHRDARLDADIRLDPGPVITFGALIPQGHDRMRPERIVEIAGLPTGLTYSPQEVARAEERLRESGVFSAVALTQTDPSSGNVMDFTAVVAESPLRRFGFGAEISTEDGGSLYAYWLHRNLFGGAERLRFDAAITGIGQQEISTEAIEGIDLEFGVRFSRPATFTPDTTAVAELRAYRLQEPGFTVTALGGEVGVEHVFDERLEGSIALGLIGMRIDGPFGEFDIGYAFLPTELRWDNRDDPLDPADGVYVAAAATPFLTTEGGAGARLLLDARGYLGFGAENRTRLAARGQIGSVIGADIAEIPPDFLFYSGGSGTVRGQEYQSLGADYGGVEAGGRGFAALSTELRQDIGESNFGIVAFADMGLISSDAGFQDDPEWHAGAGLGLRYATPFGPIRVDLATPVRGGGTGEDVFLYIGIGQAF